MSDASQYSYKSTTMIENLALLTVKKMFEPQRLIQNAKHYQSIVFCFFPSLLVDQILYEMCRINSPI